MPAKPDPQNRPKNVVRVGFSGSRYLYADITTHLLHDGEPVVYVSALSKAIPDAISVVEMLKASQMVTVKSITTSRETTERSREVDKMEIAVVKGPDFDCKYDELQKMRAQKKAEKLAASAAATAVEASNE